MNTKLSNKFISTMLAFMMFLEVVLLGYAPVVSAKENTEPPKETSRQSDVIEKSEDYTVYENEDGTRTIDMYTSDVRYKNEQGEYIDYDNSIVTMPTRRKRSVMDNYKYTNKEGMVDIKLPEDLASDVPISIQDKDNNEVKFYPIFEKEVSKEETKGELKKETVEGIYYEKEEKNTKIVYGSDDENIDMEYIPIDNGIKENIIINKPTDKNIFTYKIECSGMIPRIPEVGGVIFYDKDNPKEEVGAILTPYMTDSSENGGYSEDLKYSIEKSEEGTDTYILTLTVSKDYLESKDRVYPVIIDPTYTAKATNGVKDVYIESGYPTSNFYVSTIRKMPIGYGSTDKICRTLIKFPELQAKIKGNYVTNANLKLYELSNGSPFSTLEVHKNTSSWALGEVTWNTRPKYAATVYASKKLSNASSAHSLNITKLVQEWAKGTQANYGILLKASVESSSTKNYNSFHGTRSSTSSKRPTLSVTYTVPSPKPPAKASVTVNSASTIYLKKGTNLTVKWSGITSNCLEAVQSRYIKYGADNVFQNATELKAYSSVGSAASSGTFTVPESVTSKWGEGKYSIGVRGIDKGGNKGSGSYCFVFIDKTPPNPVSDIKLSSSRSSSDSDTANVKVTYNSSTDPGSNPSGINKYNIILYGQDGNIIQNIFTTSKNTYTFENIEANQKVYVKIAAIDNSGNTSSFVQSGEHIISNMILPEIKENNGLISNIKDNPWVNNTNNNILVSWDVDYKDSDKELDLGKITANIVKADGSSIEGFSEKNLEFEDGKTIYPKKYDRYKINSLFEKFATLPDGKYKIIIRFYSSDNVGFDEGQIVYNKDNVAPNLNIISPQENKILKGIVPISYEASDNTSGSGNIGEKRVYIIDQQKNEKLLSESLDTYNLNTTEFDEGKYQIKVVVFDMAGNKSEQIRNVSISNPPPTPIVSFENYFGGLNSKVKLNYSWVKGDEGIKKVDHIEYAINNKDNSWITINNSNPNVDDATKYDEKFVELNLNGLEEGDNIVYFRAVDSDGIYGTTREVKYTVDNTSPNIDIESPLTNSKFIDMLFIKGSISDEYLDTYEIFVAKGESPAINDFTLIKKINNTKERNNIEGTIGVINLKDNELYPVGNKFTIKVKATDKCGNISEKTFIVEKKEVINHDADFKIEKTNTADGEIVLIDDEKALINVKSLDGKEYNSSNLDYFIDGHKVLKDKNGKFDFSDIEKYSDDSTHSVLVRDNSMDQKKYSAQTYEYNLYDSITTNDEELKNTIKSNNIITLNNTTEGEYIIKNSAINTFAENGLSLKVISDDNIPQGCSIEYYLKLNDNEYIKVNNNEEYYLGGDSDGYILNSLNLDSLEFKAVLKSNGKDKPAINSVNIILKGTSSDILKIDMMNKYNPKNIMAVPQLNYKTKISWENVAKEDDNVTYEIYRSTTPDFNPNTTECVQEGVKEDYWYDNYTPIDEFNNANNNEGITARSAEVSGKRFYYKVKAVKDFNGHVRKSSGNNSKAVILPSMNEYTKRLGIKDYWGYNEFTTSTGIGYIEQSLGNFVYNQSDAYVKGKELDIELTRTYNSLSTSKTPMGYGWDFSFNPILLSTYNEYGDEQGMVFKDGSGTIYNFLKINSDKAIEEIKDEKTNKVKEIYTHYKSPLGIYVHLRKVEKLDFEDKDKDGDFSEVIDVVYIIETSDKITYTFNRSSQIQSVKDTNNNQVDFKYNERGQLSEVENYNGKTLEEINNTDSKRRSRITFDYTIGQEQSDLIQSATLPSGQVVKYKYNSDDILIKSSLYENEVSEEPYIEYSYDYVDGQLSKIIDPKGYEYGVGYYSQGEDRDRVESVQYPNGDMKKYIYKRDNGESGDLQTYNETVEEIYVNNDGILSNIFNPNTKIGESKVRYNVDGNIIYSKDILGEESQSTYIGGLERENTLNVTSYDVDENGVIRQKSEEVKNTTEYDDIADNNTIVGKIADSKGNVVKESDSEGNITKYSYNDNRANNDTNPTEMKISYDNDKSMSESYKYDSKGNLVEMTDNDSKDKIVSTYNDSGQVIKEENSIDGNVTDTTYYTYDEMGNIISQETIAGSAAKNTSTDKTENKYDIYGRLILERDARGYVTEHVYDALDREIRTIYYTKKSESIDNIDKSEYVDELYEYDKNGNLTREKDREGRETLYEYDNVNRIISKQVRLGEFSKKWTVNYSVEDVEVYFPSGNIYYDKAYVETQKNPDGEVTSVIYRDKAGNVVKNISKGNVTSFKYNKNGEVIESYIIGQDDLNDNNIHNGTIVIATYDKNGNNTKNITNPVWSEELNAYKISDKDTIVYSYKYDSLGNNIESRDPKGNITTFAYDTNSQVTKVILPTVEGSNAKNVTNHAYDIVEKATGNTITRTLNSEGQVSETVEDANGNVVRETDHGYDKEDDKKIETLYTYDQNGNMLTQTTSSGTIFYEYDDMNSMIKSVTKKNDEGEDINYSTYTYDNFGEMTSRKDYKNGELDRVALYKYDALKRLTHYYEGDEPEKDSEGNYVNVNYVVYSYDIEENLTSITYPNDINIKKVTYEYGKYDRLEKVYSSEDSSNKGNLVRKYYYAGDNRVNKIEDYRNNNDFIEKTYAYDKFGRYTSINIKDSTKQEPTEYYKYAYDKNSNIISEEMCNTNEVAFSEDEENNDDSEDRLSKHIQLNGIYHIRKDYSYDELNRIKDVKEYEITSSYDENTKENISSENLYMTTSYTYDTIGNIKSVTKNNKTSLYVYDEYGLNFLTAIKDKESGKDKVTYEYDADGNMIKENDIEHEKVTLNSYDEEGQLLKTIITDTKNNTTDTTINKYNGAGERIEKDVNGEKTYYYVVNDAVLYTYKITTDSSGTENRTITSQNVVAPDGSIISSKRSEGYYIYNLDLKGSTVSIVAPDGRYKLVYAYDIYGEPVKRGDKDFYNEITFTGAVYDESTGLFYLSSRYYDPTTGRFISMDSYRGELDDPLSLNLYAYCQGNPVKYVDRDGNMPVILSTMCVGFLTGAGVELVNQMISGEKINWEKVGAKGATSAIGAMIGVKFAIIGAVVTNVLDQGIDSNGKKDRRISVSSVLKSGAKAGISKYVINTKIEETEKSYKKAKIKPGKKTKGSKKKKVKSKKLSKQYKKLKIIKKIKNIRKNPIYKIVKSGIKKIHNGYNKLVKKPFEKVHKRIKALRIPKNSIAGKAITKVKKIFGRWFKW